MENPFESGHIKNYVLAYSSIVVIMVLFFIASTLFNDVKVVEKKIFDDNVSELKKDDIKRNIEVNASRFKLIEVSY